MRMSPVLYVYAKDIVIACKRLNKNVTILTNLLGVCEFKKNISNRIQTNFN